MFNTEEELVESIVNRFNNKWLWIKKYNKKNIEVLREVNLWYWIPDIVIVNKKTSIWKIRDKALSVFDISILDIIKKEKEINLYDLIDLTKSSKSKVNGSLSVLIDENIILNNGNDNFTFENYDSIISECIAIEVKLKNWQRALNQAHRYKWFANESYVLLPESNINPALKQLELFEKFNVWLLSFNIKWNIKVYFKPLKSVPISKQMQYLLNEYLIA